VVGLHVVYAVLAALLHRERSGGQAIAIEVPMFETMVAFNLNEHLDQATFEDGGAMGYARALAPQRKPYRTADGWIAVLPYTLPHWRRALSAVGRADLADIAWLADNGQRNQRAPELYEILERELVRKSTADWLQIFEGIDIPCGRVNTPHDLLVDPHLLAVGAFTPHFEQPMAEPAVVLRTLNTGVRFGGIETCVDRSPPTLGSDTDGVLRDAGFSAEEISILRDSGGVGSRVE
jgi:crotonobetainyl-CoA:carnitine CoA-transferase CaiB-like acyl-CoA transferase